MVTREKTWWCDQVSLRVPAKINIVLRVGLPRPDGFHELATVFHAVSLYDEITATDPNDDGAGAGHQGSVTVDIGGSYGAGVPVDESNLAVRAVHALAEAAGVPARATLRIRKHIPVAAGLAGGSADAAGALLACNELWGLRWPIERLGDVAATLGSDVPFSLIGGTAVGAGRGERLEPRDVGGKLHWVLAVADGELSTPAVYRRLDTLREAATAASPVSGGTPTSAATVSSAPAVDPRVLIALQSGDAEALGPLLENDMQAAALDLRPALRDTLRAGLGADALGGIVSGSGPTCVFLAADAGHARAVAGALAASGTCAAAEPVTGPAVPTRSTLT